MEGFGGGGRRAGKGCVDFFAEDGLRGGSEGVWMDSGGFEGDCWLLKCERWGEGKMFLSWLVYKRMRSR